MDLVKYNEETNQLEVDKNIVALLKKFEKEKVSMKLQEDKLREDLLNAMEKYNITSWETDGIKVIYKAPSKRTTIDSTRLKKELPDIAEEYSKTSDVKSSVAITIEV